MNHLMTTCTCTLRYKETKPLIISYGKVIIERFRANRAYCFLGQFSFLAATVGSSLFLTDGLVLT